MRTNLLKNVKNARIKIVKLVTKMEFVRFVKIILCYLLTVRKYLQGPI